MTTDNYGTIQTKSRSNLVLLYLYYLKKTQCQPNITLELERLTMIQRRISFATKSSMARKIPPKFTDNSWRDFVTILRRVSWLKRIPQREDSLQQGDLMKLLRLLLKFIQWRILRLFLIISKNGPTNSGKILSQG